MNDMNQESLDSVRLEVIRNRIAAIANEMGVTVQRSAYSTNIRTRRDFSCAVFDYQGGAIAHSFSQPVHLGSLTHFVPSILREYDISRMEPGDAIVCNDGYRGGVHLNDVCMLAPVFEQGRIRAYVAVIAHHLDIGGATPGSMMGLSTEILQEGLRIPPVRLVRNGQIEGDLFNFLANNIRSVRDTSGDFRAQVAGVMIGTQRVRDLFARYGTGTIETAMQAIIAYTERRVRAEIRKIPNGVYQAVDYMDDDGNEEGSVKISVKVQVMDEEVIFDLSGSDAQRRGPINATYAMTLSCCSYALRVLMSPDISSNEGFYRPCRFIAPKGTVVNASFPAPIGGGWETGNRITETAMQALAQAVPNKLAAGSKGSFGNVGFGAYSTQAGTYLTCYEAICGGYGARATKDGIDAIQAHGQNTENGPVEETEASFPVRIVRQALVPDSEGAGKYRGGLGVRRDYSFTQEVSFSVLADRGKFYPWGLAGGDQARGTHVVFDPAGQELKLPTKTSLKLKPGQVISVQMGGGGGYGLAVERDPQRVLADVRAGKVSLSRAHDVYGVVLSSDGAAVDELATKERRLAMTVAPLRHA